MKEGDNILTNEENPVSGRQEPVLTLESVKRMKATGDIPELLTALRDRSPITRQEAALVLGELPTGQGIEETVVTALIKALGDEDMNVRSSAIWSLGKISHPRAIKPLRMLSNEENLFPLIRDRAKEALEQIIYTNIGLIGRSAIDLERDLDSLLHEREDREFTNEEIKRFVDLHSSARHVALYAQAIGEESIVKITERLLMAMEKARDIIVVQGDYLVGNKIDITDSVIDRSSIGTGNNGHPSEEMMFSCQSCGSSFSLLKDPSFCPFCGYTFNE